MAAATWLVLDLADALFGLPDAEADRRVAAPPYAAMRALLGRFVGADSMLAGRDLTHGPLRFVYQLLLVDRTRDAARLLGRALWPEDEWLALRYGIVTPSIRWRHLFAALRGQV